MTKAAASHQFVIHPILFAVYSVVGIYARNAAEIPVQWAWRPLLIVVALMSLLFWALKRRLRDAQYAGLVATFALFWFFFGHFARVLQEKWAFWSTPAGIMLAFIVWTAPLVFMSSRWAWQRIRNPVFVTTFLNATSALLVVLPSFQAGGYVLQTLFQRPLRELRPEGPAAPELHAQVDPPDIYLFIMDAYGRSDVLNELYGFDNNEFIAFLKEKGFYVAEQSTPNYPQTALSVSSLLNMGYLTEATRSLSGGDNRAPLNEYLHHSDVRLALHDAGYAFVALPTPTAFTQMRDADQYYLMTIGDVNEFEGVLLSSTVLNLAIEAWHLDIPVPSYDLHRRYTLFALEKLNEVRALPGPKFVFTHIVGPHPPFVLDEDGNPIQPYWPYNMRDSTFLGTKAEYASGYTSEARYLNGRMEQVIEMILSTSDRPPIIIIQGDHGPANYFDQDHLDTSCLRERYSILNAYFFPDQNYAALYPSISPVNSFRVVFNQYFGTELPLLEDKNFYSTWYQPFDFTEVTDKVRLACQAGVD